MGSYLIPPPQKRRVPRLYSVAVAVVAVAVLVVARGVDPGVTLSIDGEEMFVRPGTTVGRLLDSDTISLVDGDLLSAADGSVLIEGAGLSAILLRNGLETTRTVRIWEGDSIETIRGDDVVEATETVREAIPFETRIEGKGPFVFMSNPGSPGVRSTVVGAISGAEVTSTVLQEPVPMIVTRRLPIPGDKVVALTFDDGPWPQTTEATLDVLAAHEASATFFVTGRQVDRYAGIARRIVEEGHLLGNHSQTHARLTGISPEEVRSEIVTAQSGLQSATGVTPQWFRPPGGRLDGSVWEQAEAAGTQLVLWDVDPQDWRKPGAEAIADRVISGVKPGSIVLLHDGGGDRAQTVEALPVIITGLRAQGYTFVTLDYLAP